MPDLKDLLIYDGEFNLTIMLWSLFIGITIAIIVSYVIKIKFGAFIRFVLERGADSPENAITLNEFSKPNSFIIRACLKNHQYYKNLLVAVTEDGKYYSNCRYYDTEPAFRQYVFKTKKSMYGDKEDGSEDAEKGSSSETVQQIDENTPISQYDPRMKQRVNFNIYSCKFYIPYELHDRAASIYFAKPTNILAVLAVIIAFAVLISFADNVTEKLLDFTKSFLDKVSGADKIV